VALIALVAGLLATAPTAATARSGADVVRDGGPAAASREQAAAPQRSRDRRVDSRRVAFDLVNTNRSSVLCLPGPDARPYRVRGRLVAPRAVVDGRDPVVTVNVLVHDAGTGGWFFHLRDRPTYDYATRLAQQGQTSLVLDRLGYGASPLADGADTCLGAQVHMLHQVVQHLYAGNYDYLGKGRATNPPNASAIVLQGHGTGATIAQLEAARFDDVDGLVLMAPATTSPSRLALDVLGGQARTCLSAGFAAYGETARAYRRLLFRTAPRPVVRAAVARRNPTPCGDVASLPGALAALTLNDREVDVPVLALAAGRDARTSGGGSTVTSTKRVTRTTVAGAGSALTLERSAPQTQRRVVRWLRALRTDVSG
jgi:dienelactone hydrolase